ncbi:RING-type domain-containing protein [Pseudoscourfieldia marina]
MLAPLVLVVLSLLLGMVTTTYAQQANVVTNQTGDGDGGNLLNEKTADAVTVSATTTTTTTTTVSKPLIKAAWQVLDTVDATTFGNHIGYTRAARVPFESGEDGLLVIAPDPIDPLRQSTHQMSTSPWLRHNGAWSPATSGGNRTRNHPVGRKIGAVVATTDDGVLAYGGIRQTDSSTAHFADKRMWKFTARAGWNYEAVSSNAAPMLAFAAGGWLASPVGTMGPGEKGYLMLFGGFTCMDNLANKETCSRGPADGGGVKLLRENSNAVYRLDLQGETVRLSDELYVYDLQTNDWAKILSHGPAARMSHACVSIDGKSGEGALICFGGRGAGGKLLSDAWVLLLPHANGDAHGAKEVARRAAWIQAEQRGRYANLNSATPSARAGHAMAASGSRIFLHGGMQRVEVDERNFERNFVPTGDLWVAVAQSCGYTEQANNKRSPRFVLTWTKIAAAESHPFAHHSLTALEDGGIYAVGGTTSESVNAMSSLQSSYIPISTSLRFQFINVSQICDGDLVSMKCDVLESLPQLPRGDDTPDISIPACGTKFSMRRFEIVLNFVNFFTSPHQLIEDAVHLASLPNVSTFTSGLITSEFILSDWSNAISLREHNSSTFFVGSDPTKPDNLVVDFQQYTEWNGDTALVNFYIGGVKLKTKQRFLPPELQQTNYSFVLEKVSFIVERTSLQFIKMQITEERTNFILAKKLVRVYYPSGALAFDGQSDEKGLVQMQLFATTHGEKYEVQIGPIGSESLIVTQIDGIGVDKVKQEILIQVPSWIPSESDPSEVTAAPQNHRVVVSISLSSQTDRQWGGNYANPWTTWNKLLITLNGCSDSDDVVVMTSTPQLPNDPRKNRPKFHADVAVSDTSLEWTYPGTLLPGQSKDERLDIMKSTLTFDFNNGGDGLMQKCGTEAVLKVSLKEMPQIVLNTTRLSFSIPYQNLDLRVSTMQFRATYACSAHGFEDKRTSQPWSGSLADATRWSDEADAAEAIVAARPCCEGDDGPGSSCHLMVAYGIGAALDAVSVSTGKRQTLDTSETDFRGIFNFEAFASTSHVLEVRFGTVLYNDEVGKGSYTSLRKPMRLNSFQTPLSDVPFTTKRSRELDLSVVQLERNVLCKGSTLLYGREGSWRNGEFKVSPLIGKQMYAVGDSCQIIIIPYANVQYSIVLKIRRSGNAPNDEILVEREITGRSNDWKRVTALIGPSSDVDRLSFSASAVRVTFRDDLTIQPAASAFMQANSTGQFEAHIGEGFTLTWSTDTESVSVLSYVFFLAMMASSVISVAVVLFAHRVMRRTWLIRGDQDAEQRFGRRDSAADRPPPGQQVGVAAINLTRHSRSQQLHDPRIRRMIRSLPRYKYSMESTDEVNMCSICLEEYETGDSMKVLPCMHKYHEACIDTWLDRDLACPICRAGLADAQTFPFEDATMVVVPETRSVAQLNPSVTEATLPNSTTSTTDDDAEVSTRRAADESRASGAREPDGDSSESRASSSAPLRGPSHVGVSGDRASPSQVQHFFV